MHSRVAAWFVPAWLAIATMQCSGAKPPEPARAPADPGHGDDRAAVDALRGQILQALQLEPGMRVAEVGLGRGWFVSRIAEAVGPRGVVYATDIDPGAVRAMEQMPRHPQGGAIRVRLCRDSRDAALDDLPDDDLDVVLMVDSLCFDEPARYDGDAAYLRKFLRVLRPGGRLVHHMDCHCAVQPVAVLRLFAAAGFATGETMAAADSPVFSTCRTGIERQRASFVAIARKPAR
jgi:SAM-dependent methyltransferase